MTLISPILDDRSFAQLKDELVRRIPVYTKEWTDHNETDPGIALLELFAYLGESVLFPRRLGTAEELAFAVLECLTNPYFNGETVRLDGGIRLPPK